MSLFACLYIKTSEGDCFPNLTNTTTARGVSLSPLERIRDEWLVLLYLLARGVVAGAVGKEDVEVTVLDGLLSVVICSNGLF